MRKFLMVFILIVFSSMAFAAPPTPPPPRVCSDAELAAGVVTSPCTPNPAGNAAAIVALAGEGSTEVVDEGVRTEMNGDEVHAVSHDDLHDWAVLHDTDLDGSLDDEGNLVEVTSLAELSAALSGSATHIAVTGTITLSGNLDLTKPTVVMSGGSFVTGSDTLTISNYLAADPFEEIFDTTSDVGVEFTNYQDIHLGWFDTSAAAVASTLHGTTLWIDGEVDLDTKGRINSDTVLHIKGNGWADSGSNTFTGSKLLWTGDGAAVEFSPASELEGATVSDLYVDHGGDTDAAILIDNVIRSKITNVHIRCNDDGDGRGLHGIRYTNAAYFAVTKDVVVQNAAGIGIYIDSSATGSEYYMYNASLMSADGSCIAGLKTEGRPVHTFGGEFRCDNTTSDGIGVWVYNGSYSVLDKPFCEATDTCIDISGSGATQSVVVNNPRFPLNSIVDRAVHFGAYARDAIVLNPSISNTSGADLAEWANSAQTQRCGIYAPNQVLLDSNINITVGAAAVGSFVHLTTPEDSMSAIVNDTNLRVYNVNGVGYETANAEEPTDGHWEIGDIVEFVDSSDASGDGFYMKTASSTWESVVGGGGSGDVSKVGTPADSQVGVWTGDGTIEGAASLTYDGSNLQLTGDIGSTGTRITKGWYTDLQVTNAIAGSVTGNAATATAAAAQAITDNAIATVDDAGAANGQVAVFTASGIEGHASVTDTELAYINGLDQALTTSDSPTFAALTVAGSASPQLEFNDSDAAGADDADEEVAQINANMITTTEDAEDSDLWFTVMQGGARTTVLLFDESDDQWETSKAINSSGGFVGALTGNADTATTAGNVSGTPALPDGTTATTQSPADNSTKLATTAYADAAAGAPTNITPVDTADENATFYPLLVDGATGSQAAETDGELTYNPSSGALTTTTFVGALTGNVTGNASGTAATVTGAAQANITSVGTLTTLTVDNLTVNGNTINADSGAVNITPAGGSAIVLDGAVNVDAGVITGATSITSTAFVGDLTGDVTGNTSGTAATVTGATQASITTAANLTTVGALAAGSLAAGFTDVPVAQGGTGASTLTDGGILLGSGTGAITALGVATNGQIPIGDGTTDPVLATLTGTANEVTITNGGGTITLSIPDSPVFVTPVLGTITSGVGTALTALDGENIQADTIDDDSIDFADVTALDITHTGMTNEIATTGIITGKLETATDGDAHTFSTEEYHGGTVLATGAGIYTLPTAAAGYSGCVEAGQGVTAIIQLLPATGDYVVLDGARGTAATALASAGEAGDRICYRSYNADDWYVTVSGTWAE